jgi:unsaturated glucuronyl hydrolase
MRILSSIVFCFLSILLAHAGNAKQVFYSPDNSVGFSVYEVGGQLKYEVSYKGKPVILESSLGIDRWKGNMEIERIDSVSVNQDWQPVYGERAVVNDCYKGYTYTLKGKGRGDKLALIVRIYNSGVGFRYKKLYDIAFSHAEVTANNQFRDDYSTCHVVVYDTLSGQRISQLTHQGYADESLWARGQAWAIYGFTMCYRETGNVAFLDVAQKATDIYLQRLPVDYIPYWDFDAPDIPEEPRDASAAAVVASGLLELSSYIKDKRKAGHYFDAAIKMLEALSSPAYLSGEVNNAFLLHSTGHKPHGSEIDASIIYADYYYVEALIRLNRINNNCKVVG